MAAAQVLPAGPHILPPPSTLPRPEPWHPPHQPQPLFTPDPALTRPRFHGHPVQEYPISSSPQSYHQSPPQLPRPTQQAAASLEQLLHPSSYHSASSGSSYTSSYQQQDSRRYQQAQNSGHNAYGERTAYQGSSSHEPFETSRQPVTSDEARLNARALPSPSQQLHRGSISSQHSSTTSLAYSTPAGSAARSPQNPRDM